MFEVTGKADIAHGRTAPGRGQLCIDGKLAGHSDIPRTNPLSIGLLNAMIDITTTRTMAAQMHPPVIIFAVLFALALVSSLLAGYGMAGGKSRSWLHMVCFAVVIAVAVYVILDMEYPRLGLIRVDAFDQALLELREGMK